MHLFRNANRNPIPSRCTRPRPLGRAAGANPRPTGMHNTDIHLSEGQISHRVRRYFTERNALDFTVQTAKRRTNRLPPLVRGGGRGGVTDEVRGVVCTKTGIGGGNPLRQNGIVKKIAVGKTHPCG